MRIELHIERVLLDGVADPRQAADIQVALAAELERLASDAGNATWQDARRRRLGVRAPAPDSRATSDHAADSATGIGTGIARAVFGGVARIAGLAPSSPPAGRGGPHDPPARRPRRAAAPQAEAATDAAGLARKQSASGPESGFGFESGLGGILQRCGGVPCACDNEDEHGGLQRSATSAGPAFAPAIVHEVLGSSGAPLDSGARRMLEPRFGRDFSGVRVHTDSRAAASAAAVQARAYTVGSHIVFGSGTYAPGTSDGLRLLAHELTHTVQQQNGVAGLATKLEVGAPDTAEEREADRTADRVLAGEPAPIAISGRTSAMRVQREANGGCGVCRQDPPEQRYLNIGNEAHRLIGAALLAKHGAKYRLSLHLELAISSLLGDIRPDIVLATPTGLAIGEIKPDNDKGRSDGEAKLKTVEPIIRNAYPNSTFELLTLDVPPTFFPNPNAVDPECMAQMLFTRLGEPGLYLYFCQPPWSQLYKKCKCRKKDDEKEDKKEREKQREKERDRPPPVFDPNEQRQPERAKDTRPETEPEGEPEVKPEVKPEPKPEPKPDPKPDPQPEPKPEPKPDPKPAPKPDPDPNPNPNPAPDRGPGERPLSPPIPIRPRPKPSPTPAPKPDEVLPIAALVVLATSLAVAFGGAAAKQSLKKIIGGRVLAYATVIVSIVLIAEGAEAHVGLEGEDPLETFFKSAADHGNPVPDDVKAAIKNNPALAEALRTAAKGGGGTKSSRSWPTS
ncbi:DUF4157 domain-containing protein [Catenulispora yoronensis]